MTDAIEIIEGKKHALRQLQDGQWVISFTCHPNDQLPDWLIRALPGQRVAITVALLNDETQASGHPPAVPPPAPGSSAAPPPASADAREAAPIPKPKRRFHELPLSQQAALLCMDKAFQRWVGFTNLSVNPSDLTVQWLRDELMIFSRADLDNPDNVGPRAEFLSLVEKFERDTGRIAQ